MPPATFRSIHALIRDHYRFFTGPRQTPSDLQLAITVYRLGHHGNSAVVAQVADDFNVSAGTIETATRRVLPILLERLTDWSKWPNEREKGDAKAFIRSRIEYAELRDSWANYYTMLDGSTFNLYARPGWDGDSFWDRKSRYSMNGQARPEGS
jgi:hypothetical protein